jgi:hypothetical protein
MGWIHKSKYKQENDNEHSINAKLLVARKLASLSIDHEFRIFSQWFPGERNIVADFLSRSPTKNHNELTNFVTSKFPSQVPKGFKVLPLPQEIESFAYNLLLNLPKPLPQHQDTNVLAQQSGPNGSNSSNPLDCTMTNSSSHYQAEEIETKSSPYLPNTLEEAEETTQLPKEFMDWLQAQSKIPSACWLRPSWKTASRTQE